VVRLAARCHFSRTAAQLISPTYSLLLGVVAIAPPNRPDLMTKERQGQRRGLRSATDLNAELERIAAMTIDELREAVSTRNEPVSGGRGQQIPDIGKSQPETVAPTNIAQRQESSRPCRL
jgi:hypothetical protein